jgi:arylsulfatase A-like enzyme
MSTRTASLPFFLALGILATAGALAFGLLQAPTGPEPPARGRKPENVLVVLCDTLRADHLGLYGYSRPTSPFIDSLARRAQVYDAAYSHYSYTWPSVSNLFTGLPYSHLVGEGLFTTPANGFRDGGLEESVDTLAERLGRRGVASAAVVANPYVAATLGFGQGFGTFHDALAWNPRFWEVQIHKYTAREVNEIAFPLLRELDRQEAPWFAYLHYFDPHMPYMAPPRDRFLFEDPGYDRDGRVVGGYFKDPQGKPLSYLTDELKSWVAPADLDYLVAQYDAEIHRFDRNVRRLFAFLEANHMLEDTTVILTADHGEAFLERGFWGHGFLSRAEEERVPLMVVPARRRRDLRPARIAEPATTTDIHFSLLRHFGALPEGGEGSPGWAVDLLTGRKLRSAVHTEGAHDAVIVRNRGYGFYRYGGFSKSKVPLPVRDGEFLFDLRNDPGEKVDLFAADPQKAARIRDRLLGELGKDVRQGRGEGFVDPLHRGDSETVRRLRALGYL